MMIENADDLRALIRAIGATEPDPAAVAAKILEMLDDADAQVVSRITLPDYTRRVLARPQPLPPPEPAMAGATYRTASGKRTLSRKVAGIIDWIDAELARHVYVPSRDTWTYLGDCTAANLIEAASSRRKQAADIEAEAERYDRIAAAVSEHEVDSVRDLPRTVLEEVLAR